MSKLIFALCSVLVSVLGVVNNVFFVRASINWNNIEFLICLSNCFQQDHQIVRYFAVVPDIE